MSAVDALRAAFCRRFAPHPIPFFPIDDRQIADLASADLNLGDLQASRIEPPRVAFDGMEVRIGVLLVNAAHRLYRAVIVPTGIVGRLTRIRRGAGLDPTPQVR